MYTKSKFSKNMICELCRELTKSQKISLSNYNFVMNAVHFITDEQNSRAASTSNRPAGTAINETKVYS